MDSAQRDRIIQNLIVDPSMVTLLKSKYVDDDIWRYCIEKEPELFEEMKNPSKDMCYFALEVDGYNLKTIRKKFKHIPITKDMIFIAIQTCPSAILYAPKKILDDGLKEFAFDKDPSLMSNYSTIRREYLEKKIEESPGVVRYIQNLPDDLACEAIRLEPNVCVYFKHLSENMKKTIETYHPHLKELYKNIY